MKRMSAKKTKEEYTKNKSLTGGVGKARKKGDNKSQRRKYACLLMDFIKSNQIKKRIMCVKKERERQEMTQMTEKRKRERAGLQIKATASSHPVSPTRLPSSSSPPSPPRSLTPGASPWQPDGVPNT